jgi:hypothetical protein
MNVRSRFAAFHAAVSDMDMLCHIQQVYGRVRENRAENQSAFRLPAGTFLLSLRAVAVQTSLFFRGTRHPSFA